jgi:hypothetical protein
VLDASRGPDVEGLRPLGPFNPAFHAAQRTARRTSRLLSDPP